MRNGKQWLAELEAKERQETGIKNLKVGFKPCFWLLHRNHQSQSGWSRRRPL